MTDDLVGPAVMISVGAAVMIPISVAVSSQEHSSLLFLPFFSFFFFFFFLSAKDSDLIGLPEDVPVPEGQVHSFEPDFPPDSLEPDPDSLDADEDPEPDPEPDPDSLLPFFFFFLLSSDSSARSSASAMRSFDAADRDLADLAETRSVIRITPKTERMRAIFIVVIPKVNCC